MKRGVLPPDFFRQCYEETIFLVAVERATHERVLTRADEAKKWVIEEQVHRKGYSAEGTACLMRKIRLARLESLVAVEHRGNYRDALPSDALLQYLGYTPTEAPATSAPEAPIEARRAPASVMEGSVVGYTSGGIQYCLTAPMAMPLVEGSAASAVVALSAPSHPAPPPPAPSVHPGLPPLTSTHEGITGPVRAHVNIITCTSIIIANNVNIDD